MIGVEKFLQLIDNAYLTAPRRACAILWWAGRENPTVGIPTSDICKIIENAGHPKQNISRLSVQLSKMKKIVSRVPGQNAWRLHPNGRKKLDEIYEPLIKTPRRPQETSSILSKALFAGTRGYIEKIVFQINASYDGGLFDCCAVMCRRLLETLIIELYESVSRATDIHANNGNFFMFSELLHVLESDSAFNISRNGLQGLHDFKKLGDLSAHNRRFNAIREDNDRVQNGMRIASEELLHMAKLI